LTKIKEEDDAQKMNLKKGEKKTQKEPWECHEKNQTGDLDWNLPDRKGVRGGKTAKKARDYNNTLCSK